MTPFLDFARTRLPTALRPLAQKARRIFLPTLAETISRERFARERFHPPKRNNFVEVFFPRSVDADGALRAVHGAAAALNQADGELLEYCEDFARRFPLRGGLEAIERFVYWKHLRVERSFLEGVQERRWILSRIAERAGESVSELLAKENPELLDSLCRMPREFERVFRINVFLDPTRTRALLRALGEEIRRNPSLIDSLTRFEIATLAPKGEDIPPFPVAIFYFDVEARSSGCYRPLAQWLSRSLPSEFRANVSSEFAERWHPASTMTEGFRLYKQYLDGLGCLSRVYDPATNFAYAHERAEE